MTTAEISLLLQLYLPLSPSHNHRKDFLATIIMRGRRYNTVSQHTQSRTRTLTHAELDTPGLPQAINVGFPLLLPRRLEAGREGKGERGREGGREEEEDPPLPPH